MAQTEMILTKQLEKLAQYLGYLEVLHAKCCGLTMVQSTVIVAIGNAPDLSVNGLADELRLNKSTASKHVTNLVDIGYVTRTESQEDRRFFVLNLTDKGQATYKTIQKATKDFYGLIFDKMEQEDQEALKQGLQALLSAIKTADCC